jgi:tripartite ATP-independent transporter DctP family solute receptor
MKKTVAMVLVLGVLLLVGCGSGGSSAGKSEAAKAPETKSAEKVELKVAHTLANTEETHLVVVDMAKRIAEKTNGNFVINVYPNAELGSNVDNLEQMMRGANIMSLMSPDFLATYVPDIGILDGPFLFSDYKDFKKITASSWYADVSAQMEKKGIKLLAMDWFFGSRHIAAKKVLKTPADLKGIRFRSAASPGRVAMTVAMGANAIQMNWSETYSALNQGIVDACEAPLSTLYGSKIYEVCKNIALTGHILSIMGVEISASWFNALSPENQKLLTDEINKTGEIYNERVVANEAEWRKKLEAEGVAFNEVDKAAFRKACESFYTKFPNWTPGLYDTVKAILK